MSATDQFSGNPMPLFEGQELLFTGPKGGELSYVKDHRQRLHHRFAEGGARGMPDYELLGLILQDHLIIGKSREVSMRSGGYL